MVRFYKFYKRFILFFLFLCVLMLLLSPEMQKKPLQIMGLPLGSAVFTLQLGTETLFGGIGDFWAHYINLMDVQKENEALRNEIAELKGDNNRLREEVILTERLKALLDYKMHSRLDLLTASIVGRQASQWFDTITINKGGRDGVKIDMGVLVPEGIVGKVIQTGPHYAQVLLISDRNSALGAIVQRTREEGIVQGSEQNSVRMKYLAHDAEIKEGDILVTSGMEGSFSKGLEIGEVKKVALNEDKMFLNIRVALSVNLDKLEDILVIRRIEDQPERLGPSK